MKLIRFVTNELSENAYFLFDEDTKAAILVDPGGSADKLIEFLEENNLRLKAILLTHGHFDHIMAVNEIKEFTGAPIVACAVENEMLADAALNMSKQMGWQELKVNADILLQHGDCFDFDNHTIKMIHTPGHTKGGCCYYCNEEPLLFSGDTLFLGSIGRSDLKGGDGDMLIFKIKSELFNLPDETVVYPGHGEATSIGHEKKHNHFCKL